MTEPDDYSTRQKYITQCSDCDVSHTVFTQADDSPEYYTDVHILCACGSLVSFNLPVN